MGGGKRVVRDLLLVLVFTPYIKVEKHVFAERVRNKSMCKIPGFS